MKTVLLMRHAKSSWKDYSLADHDRPLNKRGKRSAPVMGEVLVKNGLVPDTAICSTARRASDTLELLQTTCPIDGPILHSRDIYHGDLDTFIDYLSKLSDDYRIAILVGHNPEMDHAVSVLSGTYENMVTAAIAAIEFDIENWKDLMKEPEGKLKGFWKPRDYIS